MKKFVLLLLLLPFLACESDDENTAQTSLINIETAADFLEADTRMFYSIKGENGANLANGEVFNSDNMNITGEYEGDKISLTIIYYNVASNDVSITSYLGLEKGESTNFKKDRFSFLHDQPKHRLKYQFINFPRCFEKYMMSTVSLTQKAFKYQIENNKAYNYTNFVGYPSTVFMMYFEDQIPQYQELFFGQDDINTIDINNNIDMENFHNVVLAANTPDTVGYSISGALNLSPKSYEYYPIERTSYGPSINPINIPFFTPDIFRTLKLSIYSQQNELSYGNVYIGDIPSTTVNLNTELNITDNSLANFNMTTSGDQQISSTKYQWTIENNENLSWSVISKGAIANNYNVHELPESLLDIMTELQNIDQLKLTSFSAFKEDNLVFPENISTFQSDDSDPSVWLRKTITF